jgi:DNA-binding ferritin-like protein
MVKLPKINSDKAVESYVNELMNSRTSFHKLHLKVTGPGSYAAHKALDEFYNGIVDHIDNIVEQYQGATERLLDIPDSVPTKLNSVQDALLYLKDLCSKTTYLQSQITMSEIVNQLDEVKSLIDSTIYKLKFLS